MNASWWRKWCDYVNFTEVSKSPDASDSEQSPTKPQAKWRESVIFYDKPGKIVNEPLLYQY